MTTIQDIAADLGLSAMTVSRALNWHPDVKEETRLRVEERARALNYRPNRWARSLVTRESRIIGVVIPEISHTFFSEIMAGVQEAIEPHGYTLLLCHSGADAERERREVDMLVGSRADGLIVASAFSQTDASLFAELRDQGVPFVLVDRYFSDVDFPSVRADDRALGRMAARHLIGLGHKRIGCIRGPDVSSSNLRFEGAREALAEAGLELRPEWVAGRGFSFESGVEAMREILRAKQLPTAICAVNDPVAFGAVRACREDGWSVPGAISIIGAGAIEGDHVPEPFLTTFDWSRREMGLEAGKMLLMLMEGKELTAGRERVLTPVLRVRRSTAPPPTT